MRDLSTCDECVTIYGAYFCGRTHEIFISMQLCELSVLDLLRILQTGLKEPVVAAIARDMVKGLAWLHGRRYIHRDLKSGNVLLLRNGSARLCDFGVSASLGGASHNTVVGSPFWMAPEVISTVGYSLPADIWSLGISVIEMLEMVPPRSHLHPMKALLKIPELPAPRLDNPKESSEELRSFIDVTLVKDAAGRYTAQKLCSHPWIKSAGTKNTRMVSESIEQALEIVARMGSREAAMELREEEEEPEQQQGQHQQQQQHAHQQDAVPAQVLKSHEELIHDALQTLRRKNFGSTVHSKSSSSNNRNNSGSTGGGSSGAKSQRQQGISLVDDLAWEGSNPKLRSGIRVELSPSKSGAGAATSAMEEEEEAPRQRPNAAQANAIRKATIRLSRQPALSAAEPGKVVATSVSSKAPVKRKKRIAKSSNNAADSEKQNTVVLLGDDIKKSKKLSRSSTSSVAEPPSPPSGTPTQSRKSVKKTSSGQSSAAVVAPLPSKKEKAPPPSDVPPAVAATMKKLTRVGAALKKLIGKVTAGTVTKDEALFELQDAALKLADLVGDPTMSHPECLRISARLAKVRQKATILALAIDDRSGVVAEVASPSPGPLRRRAPTATGATPVASPKLSRTGSASSIPLPSPKLTRNSSASSIPPASSSRPPPQTPPPPPPTIAPLDDPLRKKRATTKVAASHARRNSIAATPDGKDPRKKVVTSPAKAMTLEDYKAPPPPSPSPAASSPVVPGKSRLVEEWKRKKDEQVRRTSSTGNLGERRGSGAK